MRENARIGINDANEVPVAEEAHEMPESMAGVERRFERRRPAAKASNKLRWDIVHSSTSLHTAGAIHVT
jgi:hypothetical protein